MYDRFCFRIFFFALFVKANASERTSEFLGDASQRFPDFRTIRLGEYLISLLFCFFSFFLSLFLEGKKTCIQILQCDRQSREDAYFFQSREWMWNRRFFRRSTKRLVSQFRDHGVIEGSRFLVHNVTVQSSRRDRENPIVAKPRAAPIILTLIAPNYEEFRRLNNSRHRDTTPLFLSRYNVRSFIRGVSQRDGSIFFSTLEPSSTRRFSRVFYIFLATRQGETSDRISRVRAKRVINDKINWL